MNPADSRVTNPLERVLVRLDELPYVVLPRMVFGYFVVAVWDRLLGARGWLLLPLFVLSLIGWRMGMMVARRVLHFGPAVSAIWLDRRQLAKRADSYQWQKLFGMGLGMAVYAASVEQRSGALVALTLFCLLSGAIGLGIWLKSRAVMTREIQA